MLADGQRFDLLHAMGAAGEGWTGRLQTKAPTLFRRHTQVSSRVLQTGQLNRLPPTLSCGRRLAGLPAVKTQGGFPPDRPLAPSHAVLSVGASVTAQPPVTPAPRR